MSDNIFIVATQTQCKETDKFYIGMITKITRSSENKCTIIERSSLCDDTLEYTVKESYEEVCQMIMDKL